MSRVFWDTNLFIYLFEDYGAFSEGAGQLRLKMLDRGDQLSDFHAHAGRDTGETHRAE